MFTCTRVCVFFLSIESYINTILIYVYTQYICIYVYSYYILCVKYERARTIYNRTEFVKRDFYINNVNGISTSC